MCLTREDNGLSYDRQPSDTNVVDDGDSSDNMMLQHSLIAPKGAIQVEFVPDNVHSMKTADEQLGRNSEPREEKWQQEGVVDILSTPGKERSV